MAQRTIHMLFATKLTDKVDIKDKNRFFIGSILPDAYINHEDRDKTHFIKRIQQLDYKINYIDFGEFYKKYCNKIMSDDLYLGYYAHLIEDAFYRHYLYHEKDYMEKIKSHELEVLHTDYHILNSFISHKYDMPVLEIEADMQNEILNAIAPFDISGIIREYERDIVENIDQKAVILTESMLEEYVSEYVDLAARELCSSRKGKSILNTDDYKWITREDKM
ncbi:MAG: hypothetical protein SOT58_04440 [Agathobacter sp.]|nr:hypothetical protein [Lachnobacterium sp.]MDY2911287.1 hypothetical protein [Agathobacter sp.]